MAASNPPPTSSACKKPKIFDLYTGSETSTSQARLGGVRKYLAHQPPMNKSPARKTLFESPLRHMSGMSEFPTSVTAFLLLLFPIFPPSRLKSEPAPKLRAKTSPKK